MDKISYKLDVFEGPLDLLLHLIEKNKLNIYDIQISELCEQYVEHIRTMQEENLDIAGEFLDMASRLIQIKSAMLLPKYDEGEEMKKELTGQLIEYRKCKQMAKILSEKISFDSFCREPEKIKCDMKYKRKHEPVVLVNAYMAAVGRGKQKIPPSEDAFSGIVKRRIVSVSSKIIGVMKKLWGGRSVRYEKIFEDSADKSELVATFLAVLELIKGKRVRADGEGEDLTLKMISGGGKHWKKEN
ncbi:MAG: segregation and condensation protein A [Acutalibacteraceae bacterium]